VLAGGHDPRGQAGAALDDVVVGQHQAGRGDDHAGGGGRAALVLQVAGDVDDAGLDRGPHRLLGGAADVAAPGCLAAAAGREGAGLAAVADGLPPGWLAGGCWAA